MEQIDTKIDTILDQKPITNVQIEINGTTIDNEHHQMNEEIQAIYPTQAIEEACLDNDITTTIGTPSTHEIEDHHETIDPLEIDRETATAATLATIAQEQGVNHLIVLINHRQTIDDQLLIQYNHEKTNTQVLTKNLKRNGL